MAATPVAALAPSPRPWLCRQIARIYSIFHLLTMPLLFSDNFLGSTKGQTTFIALCKVSCPQMSTKFGDFRLLQKIPWRRLKPTLVGNKLAGIVL
jgi:hypothetical protein